MILLPAEDIGAEDTADDVAQMRDIVDVWQSTGHKNVFLVLLWQADEKLTERFECQDVLFTSSFRALEWEMTE